MPPKHKPLATTTTTHRRRHRRRNTNLSPLISAVTSAISAATSFLHHHDHLLPHPLSLSLHSSLHSSSLSLSSLQSLIPNSQTVISNCWFEKLLQLDEQDPRWVQSFRMSKPTFSLLNSLLSHSISSILPSVSSHFALGAALYRLAHDGSFSDIGYRFGITPDEACRAFYAVCKVVCDQLGGYVGEFGSDVGSGFDRVSLPGCCGVLGVERFALEGDVLGKDGFLMVQALVDSNGRFLDVSAGWPSVFRPDTVLQQTRLFAGVEGAKWVLDGLPVGINGGGEDGVEGSVSKYILGGSCYPLMPWLMTPYLKRGGVEELSSEEREFNEVHHKKGMWFFKVAFRRIRAIWKLLDRRWKEELVEFLPFVIVTACLLNNFMMKHGETLPDGELGCVGEEGELPVCDEDADESSRRTRDLIASHLSRVSQRK